jgi:hypothetical protein
MRRVNASSHRRTRAIAAALLLVRASVVSADGASAPDPSALWERGLVIQRFPDLRAEATLATAFPSGEQVTLELRIVAMVQPDGTSRMALARVTSGGPLRDSAFLTVENSRAADDLWFYLPAVGSPRRLASSNLADSYLGSEFRYGDLVQPEPGDYVATLRGEEVVEGEPCWIIEVTPREARVSRDTGLARETLWLRQSNLVERKVEQYDRRGALLKVLDVPRLYTDPGSGKIFALERRVRNVQTHAVSTVVFENVQANRGVSADLFSPARLADRSWE